MKLAVVTDSTAYIPDHIQDKENLFIIPIPVILDGKIYNEGEDIEADMFYSLLKNSKEFPTTSQPPLGEILTLYQEIALKGYDTILSIHLSSGISGFVNTLNGIKNSVDGVNIIPYDSEITSLPMGHMVETAIQLGEKGADIEEILTQIDTIRDTTYAYLIVDDLNNLVRGGRLTNGAAIVGGLLKIKPILTFEEGKIVLSEKIRSAKKALHRSEELIDQRLKEMSQPAKLFVIHGKNPEVAKEEMHRLQEKYPDIEIDQGHFGPVIGAHLGEGAVALAIAAK